ncbi:MAG: hypothetical protein JSR45_01915 [Proteobacteria bacterium]|nr:hypothetical protein [Pseudomonadota bacterium]
MAFDLSAFSGDLILGLGGAVGGALVAALIAAVTGRNAGLGLLAVGVIVGGASLPLGARLLEHPPSLQLGRNAVTSAPESASADEDPILSVLRRLYPDDYAKVKGLAPGLMVLAPGNQAKAHAIMADLMRRTAPKANDENMMAFMKIARDEAGTLAEASPERCGEAMQGGALPLAGGRDRREQELVLARFLEQAAVDPAPAHASVDLRPAMDRMAKSALAKLPADERKIVMGSVVGRSGFGRPTDKASKVAYCHFILSAFDELLRRPAHESAGVMRTLMLKQGL